MSDNEENGEKMRELEVQIAEQTAKLNELKEKYESLRSLPTENELTKDEIVRYSRQMILPELGVEGQLKLKQSSILIVGVGGLGCPAAMYLAAAGVGTIGLLDYDAIELSNLHRQILHSQERIGMCKATSGKKTLQFLNPDVKVIPHHVALNSSNAMEIIQCYDVVLDATDNVATRYLLNDACVLAKKPLISGSALRWEGQLTVYNYNGGPCYRCLYPKPPPPEAVTNCSDGGVVGVVPGIIGSVQALEAIKMLVGLQVSYSQKLLVFDGLDGTFRNVKLRNRQEKCAVCSENPSITTLIDYVQFCGANFTDKDRSISILDKSNRISPREYKQIVDIGIPHILVDVRMPTEVAMCCLPNTVNLPITDLEKNGISKLKESIDTSFGHEEKVSVYVVCRRGNDSQLAVELLKSKLNAASIQDIEGGLHAWAKEVDTNFPIY